MTSLLITNAQLPDGSTGSIAVRDGRIVESVEAADTTIDATGLVALPGLVDMHVHLREPGKEDAETVATGSASAARGGGRVHRRVEGRAAPSAACGFGAVQRRRRFRVG